MTRFAVIVVHRNGAEMLLRTLDAVAAAADPARDAVFLVDNASSDDSLARVRAARPAVAIIENGCNMGYAAAINQAVPGGGVHGEGGLIPVETIFSRMRRNGVEIKRQKSVSIGFFL